MLNHQTKYPCSLFEDMFNEKLSVYKPFFHFRYHVAHALEDSPIRESDNKTNNF